MTDTAENGTPPPLTTEQSEQLYATMVDAILQQTLQLLALVGVGVGNVDQLRAGAEQQLKFQESLQQQLDSLLQEPARSEFPIIGAIIKKASATTIMLPGQPASPGFPIAGPKKLQPDDLPANIVGTFAALQFYLLPHLRLAVNVLGLQIEFIQYPPQPLASPLKKPWRGPAR